MKSQMKTQICLAIVVASAALCSLPRTLMAQQNSDPVTWIGGPLQVNPNDRALVCATNLAPETISVSLELVDAITGLVVLQQNATLGAVGGTSNPGACLDSATASRAIIGVLVGRIVAVNPQPLPPSHEVVASLQVLGADSSGSAVNYRYAALLPLHPPEPCRVGR